MARRRERLPLLALAAGSVAALFFILPLAGLLWRAPWRSFISDLGAPDVRSALRLSLETSLAATALCMAFGLPLAWVLARMAFPGRRLLRALTILPMVLPPVVGGIALIYAFGRRGIRAVPGPLVRDRPALHHQGGHPGRGSPRRGRGGGRPKPLRDADAIPPGG